MAQCVGRLLRLVEHAPVGHHRGAVHLPHGARRRAVEGIWSVLRRPTTANRRALADPQNLIDVVRPGLRRLQYRHEVLDGRLTGTGRVPDPPWRHHAF